MTVIASIHFSHDGSAQVRDDVVMLRTALEPDDEAHVVLAGDFNFAANELDKEAPGGGLRPAVAPEVCQWEACLWQLAEVLQPEPTTARAGWPSLTGLTATRGCQTLTWWARARPGGADGGHVVRPRVDALVAVLRTWRAGQDSGQISAVLVIKAVRAALGLGGKGAGLCG